MINTLNVHTDEVHSVAISPDGAIFASGSLDNTCIIWSMDNLEELHKFNGFNGRTDNLHFSPNGEILAMGTEDDEIKLVSTSSYEEIHTLYNPDDWLYKFTFNNCGDTIAVAGGDQKYIQLWSVESGELLKSITSNREVHSIQFFPDDKFIASGGFLGYFPRSFDIINVHYIESGRKVHSFRGGVDSVCDIAFSSDGKQMATGCGG